MERYGPNLHASWTFGERHPQWRQVSVDVLDGLEYLHRLDVVHTDVKSGNIPRVLVNGQRFVIADVDDFARIGELNPAKGTAPWAHPDLLRGGVAARPLWDLWAMAVLVLQLHCGVFPYEGETSADFGIAWEEALLAGRLSPRAVPGVPPELAQLLSSCWADDADVTARSILERLPAE
eukprot:TRINITY_DN30037_c1_g1_i2.p1 TRINITY_DN30037_c1_g1~~TRINITY_DN30037_c1_g1_i2.p1  ORF type:complete len:178 (+),score=46.93 TRINITY_DN30037_c1_g1_i2:268-801(+)